jgi:hypothetical protein
MRLPGCRHDHAEEDILRAAASIAGRRQTPHKSGGRPKGPRCPKCGKVPSRCRGHAE